ncbi:MAG: ADP-forming succinate--CoA ligase subunit beta [Herpetosiphon sp.]
MKLHEYQARDILQKYGVPVTGGGVAATADEARRHAESVGGHVAVKAQVLFGGRGKAGGIKVVNTAAEAEAAAKQILGMRLVSPQTGPEGVIVHQVLVAEAIDYAREVYLSVILDRGTKQIVLLASAEGGMEIEEVAQTNPDAIKRVAADPTLGLQEFQARELAFAIGLDDGKQARQFASIAMALYRVFVENDASLVEINPLVIKKDGSLLALDSKVLVDDSALFRHTALAEMQDDAGEPEAERKAAAAGLTFIKLDGDIGCMVNGAGLAMATMDVVNLYGGKPANFLDIGGGANAQKVASALDIILDDDNVKAVLINIFGGITRGDEVAKGIVTALAQIRRRVPMVVRLVGTNAEEGARILKDAALIPADSLADAAKKVVAVAKETAAA